MKDAKTTSEVAEHLGISRREWSKCLLEACTQEDIDFGMDAGTLDEIRARRAEIIAGESGRKGAFWKER